MALSHARLPPELHDRILDFLFDAKPTLSACSLVSRDWRITSQYHLFHTLTLRHPAPLAAFTAFLASSPRLAHFVRDLTLCGTDADAPSIHYTRQLPLAAHTLAACTACLPQLRTLALVGVWCTDTDPRAGARPKREPTELITGSPRARPHVERVRVRKAVATRRGLFDTLCVLGGVGALEMERVFWVFDGESDAQPAQPPETLRPAVRDVVVGASNCGDFLGMFLAGMQERMDMAAVRSLVLHVDNHDAWWELRAFLRAVSPQLRRLSLSLGNRVEANGATENNMKDLRLSSLAALESFAVHLPHERASESPAPSGRAVALLYSVLSQLPATVHDLTVVCSSHAEEGAEWSAIDDLLAGSKALRQVTIRADRTSAGAAVGLCLFNSVDLWDYVVNQRDRLVASVKQKLPQLEVRGILLVE